jgi:hypothetical protein
VTVTLYTVTGDPPSLTGGGHDTVAVVPEVGVNDATTGSGARAGISLTIAVFPVIGELFAVVIATTVIWYAVPLSNPVNTYELSDWEFNVAVATSESSAATAIRRSYRVNDPPPSCA